MDWNGKRKRRSILNRKSQPKLNANSTSNYTTSLFAKISLLWMDFISSERMACCCHLQAHLSAHLSAHLQAHLSAHLQAHLSAHFVFATLIAVSLPSVAV